MAGLLLHGLVAPDSLADMVEGRGGEAVEGSVRDPGAGTSVSPILPLCQRFLFLRPTYEGELKGAVSGSEAGVVPGSIHTAHRGSIHRPTERRGKERILLGGRGAKC